MGGRPLPPPIKLLQLPEKTPAANRKGVEHSTTQLPVVHWHLYTLLSSHPDSVVGMEKDSSQSTLADRIREKTDRLVHGLS